MATGNTITGRDLYLRLTVPATRRSHMRCVRVWDAERFVTSLNKQHADADAEAIKNDETPDLMHVDVISEAEYRREHWANRK